jgi:short-chain fatty acids transporter
MSIAETYIRFLKRFLPSPFTIAVVLTLAVIVAGTIFTPNSLTEIAGYWNTGIWELLAFAMQMILMLILGHALAISPVADRFFQILLKWMKSGTSAAVIIAVMSIITGSINWGLGLITGAILAKKIHETAARRCIPINFPLIATCGYLALMVWHAGASGTAPLTVATPDHSLQVEVGIISADLTLLSGFNLLAFFLILITLPALAYYLAKKSAGVVPETRLEDPNRNAQIKAEGAEKLDHSKWVGRLTAALMGAVLVASLVNNGVLSIFTINNINLTLLLFALLAHGTFHSFVNAVREAMQSATGIAIQFPLYAGIMGVMKYSGLASMMATGLVGSASSTSFPILALISSGIINVLIPSGGGQWQIQGPILIEAAQQIGYPLERTVMALAYGDQLTNMLQPFWALPLLGITGLKVKDILPYSLAFMVVGLIVYTSVLLWF